MADDNRHKFYHLKAIRFTFIAGDITDLFLVVYQCILKAKFLKCHAEDKWKNSSRSLWLWIYWACYVDIERDNFEWKNICMYVCVCTHIFAYIFQISPNCEHFIRLNKTMSKMCMHANVCMWMISNVYMCVCMCILNTKKYNRKYDTKQTFKYKFLKIE